MPPRDHSPDADDQPEALRLLHRLAEILKCEPEAFFRGTIGNGRRDQQAELWRLWQAIDSDDKREQVLRLMRAIVGSDNGPPPGGAMLS